MYRLPPANPSPLSIRYDAPCFSPLNRHRVNTISPIWRNRGISHPPPPNARVAQLASSIRQLSFLRSSRLPRSRSDSPIIPEDVGRLCRSATPRVSILYARQSMQAKPSFPRFGSPHHSCLLICVLVGICCFFLRFIAYSPAGTPRNLCWRYMRFPPLVFHIAAYYILIGAPVSPLWSLNGIIGGGSPGGDAFAVLDGKGGAGIGLYFCPCAAFLFGSFCLWLFFLWTIAPGLSAADAQGVVTKHRYPL